MFGGLRTAWLANIRLHPIKGLDPVSVREARIGPNGGLELDRVWALFSVDGQWINGTTPVLESMTATLGRLEKISTE